MRLSRKKRDRNNGPESRVTVVAAAAAAAVVDATASTAADAGRLKGPPRLAQPRKRQRISRGYDRVAHSRRSDVWKKRSNLS